MNPIDPLHRHYAFENPPTVYDEDAVTALELCARTAKKTNECVDAFNRHLRECDDQNLLHEKAVDKKISDQNKVIAGAVDFMKDNIDNSVSDILHQLHEAGQLEGVLQSQYFVTPQMYGAVGDGVTDDTKAFQDAFEASKRVFIPRGEYYVQTIQPGSCEVIGEQGATLIIDGAIQYVEVYYPRLKNLTIRPVTGFTGDYLVEIYDSYYGVFDSLTFRDHPNAVLVHGSVGAGCYYQRFSNCVFDNHNIGITFSDIANAHTVEKSVFYRCGTGISIKGAENIVIRDNTFQSYTNCGVSLDSGNNGHPISSVIMGNYFEANIYSNNRGDITMNNCDEVTGNFILLNHYTYQGQNIHVTEMVAPNMILDYYNRQEANAPNTLIGLTALEPVPESYKGYGGERYHGSVVPMVKDDDRSDLYFYGMENGTKGWKRVLTTGLSENDSIVLPPIVCQSINQFYEGYIQMGYDWKGGVGATTGITFDTNHNLIKRMAHYDPDGCTWDYIQNVKSGTTANRPTWAPRGYMMYDATLGKPIWSKGDNTWVDATGAPV